MRPDPGSLEYMQRRARTFTSLPHDERRKFIRRYRYAAYRDGFILLQVLIALHGARCMACGSSHRLTLDHILPVSKGGRTTMENVQILCRRCNKAKGDSIMDFREE